MVHPAGERLALSHPAPNPFQRLLIIFDRTAERQERLALSTGDLQRSKADSPEIFDEFIGRLEELQEEGEFYDLWSILRGSSGTPFTEERYRKFKHIEIFEPIEEAALRYYCDGKLTDLSKAYSDLREGKKSPVEELGKAIEKGKYDL